MCWLRDNQHFQLCELRNHGTNKDGAFFRETNSHNFDRFEEPFGILGVYEDIVFVGIGVA